jgi:hypothetical protein
MDNIMPKVAGYWQTIPDRSYNCGVHMLQNQTCLKRDALFFNILFWLSMIFLLQGLHIITVHMFRLPVLVYTHVPQYQP